MTIYYHVQKDPLKITISTERREGLSFSSLEDLSDYVAQQEEHKQPDFYHAYFLATQEAMKNKLYLDIMHTLTRSKTT